MKVYGIDIPDGDKLLTNFDLIDYAQKLGINHFRGVFMRDTLHKIIPHYKESGIVNLNTIHQPGSHWVCPNEATCLL